MNTDFPKDKYGYEIPRCHYVSAIGSQCNAPPMTGEHFCYSHNPRIAAERLEAQRSGGRNRRQPEPPPRIPPNLPLVQFESRGHILVLYEATINFVLQGQMDLRVANTIGYLAQGALATLDSQARADRQATQDAEKAAEKAARRDVALLRLPQAAEKAVAPKTVVQKTEVKVQKAAEREPEQAGKAAQEEAAQKESKRTAEKAVERAGSETQNRQTEARQTQASQTKEAQKTEPATSTIQSVYGFVPRDQYGRKQRIIYSNTATGPELEFVPNTRPPLIVSPANSTPPAAPSAEQGAMGVKAREATDLK